MNKSKISFRLLLVILLFSLIILVSACNFGGISTGGFTVGLSLNGGEGLEAKDFISGNKLVEPMTLPTKKGCEFLGWYYDSDFETEITFNVQITKNITIHAKWSDVAWTVTFVYWGDIESVVIKVPDKGKATAPAELPEQNGYAILGWYKNSNYATSFSFTQTIEDDISIYAKGAIRDFEINYHFDSGTPHINTIYSYTINNAVTLAVPTRTGYEFLGWYDNEEFGGNPVTTIVKGSYGNKDFYAKYLCDKNDIENTMLGAIITENSISISVSYLSETITLNDTNIMVSDRATFVVTNDSDEVYQDNTVILPDAPESGFIVITAKIVVTSEKGTDKVYVLTINKYAEGASVTVTFDTDIAPPIGLEVIPISSQIIEPVLGDVLGHTFDGWYNEDTFSTAFDFDSLIGDDKTLYAKFTPIPYNINYVLGVGENVLGNVASYTILDEIVFVKAESTDLYDFVGWYTDKNFTSAIVSISSSTGDISIYAKYGLKVDNSAMILGYSGSQTFTSEQNYQLTKYLEHIVYEKLSPANFTLTLNDEAYDTFIQTAWKNVALPKSTIDWDASRSEGNVTMNFTYENFPDKSASIDDKYTQLEYLMHEEYTATREINFDDFKIKSVGNVVEVSSSEMLFYVLSQGYRPLPVANTAAERIYNEAKAVLRVIIDDSMNDIEKLHKIYDWLIMNVVYDKELFDLTTSNELPESVKIHSYNGFYLEGVFDDHRAVCDGISKALVVLARIEGIEAYQVIYAPESVSVGHAWNKVRVDGEYYIIDATSGGTIVRDDEVLTHKYFMLSDSKFKELTAKGTELEGNYFVGYEGTSHVDKVAQTDYNVYLDIVIEYELTQFDMVISSQEELNTLFEIYKEMKDEYTTKSFTIDVYIDFDYGGDITDEINIATDLILLMSYSLSFDKGYLILLVIR